MQNHLSDLNNHLFEQLERLMDDDICKDAESTQKEIEKSNAVVNIAEKIIDVGNLQLNAVKVSQNWNMGKGALPELLEEKK